MSRIEKIRARMGESSLVFNQNQKISKDIREIRKRFSGSDDRKAQKSEQRRTRHEQFVQDHIADAGNRTMKPYQLREYRKGLPPRDSFRRLFNGITNADDIVDIMEHEHVVETYLSEKETEVTIRFVDIPRRVRRDKTE